ncbi:hypothetical protein [Sinorhizobium psoraleae]|uniref:Uncharacterized protein n=1 Tax=Sinorhizobium psoraleae TaxID=520838 RepID=A0ABT4KB71_9HYPH|nr:hypothetical protein [Sinorhizobium psoraleae]MCZ4089070.1 hypothetical protein [Sinorhizobium psoraleae]
MELAANMKGDLVGNQQISNSDMAFVQQVAAGDTNLDAGTIRKLVDIREKQLKGNVENYNSRVDAIYPDSPENKANRSFLGGIAVPENPYADKETTGSVETKTGRVPSAAVVDGWEYFIGADGKKYKRRAGSR